MAGNNAGCLVISNETTDPFFVLDGENASLNLYIPPMSASSFGGTIFPWCNNASEVKFKAFRFFRRGVGAFYMFYTASDFAPQWTPYNGGSPSFEQRQRAGPSGSYVDVFIQPDGTPRTVRAWG